MGSTLYVIGVILIYIYLSICAYPDILIYKHLYITIHIYIYYNCIISQHHGGNFSLVISMVPGSEHFTRLLERQQRNLSGQGGAFIADTLPSSTCRAQKTRAAGK